MKFDDFGSFFQFSNETALDMHVDKQAVRDADLRPRNYRHVPPVNESILVARALQTSG